VSQPLRVHLSYLALSLSPQDCLTTSRVASISSFSALPVPGLSLASVPLPPLCYVCLLARWRRAERAPLCSFVSFTPLFVFCRDFLCCRQSPSFTLPEHK
jgi:hypothetical protein